MTRRQLVVFDFDGTLADSWRDLATALNTTLREAGLREATDSEVRAWIGEGLLRLLERALPASQQEPERITALYARVRELYERCCLDATTPYPGIAECLTQLSPHALAILSNKPAAFLMRMVAGLGLADHFALVVGGDALPAPKPDPRAVANVASLASFSIRDTWMVGDSALDIAAGRAAGARTIGCTWGYRSEQELRNAQAEFVVEHPREIPTLIAQPPRRGERQGRREG